MIRASRVLRDGSLSLRILRVLRWFDIAKTSFTAINIKNAVNNATSRLIQILKSVSILITHKNIRIGTSRVQKPSTGLRTLSNSSIKIFFLRSITLKPILRKNFNNTTLKIRSTVFKVYLELNVLLIMINDLNVAFQTEI